MSVLPIVIYPSNPASHAAHKRKCPQCNGSVVRVRRRFIDRLMSLITPMHRYRCGLNGWGCDWKGNLS
jgi:hypothetical protein